MCINAHWVLAALLIARPLQGQSYRLEPECPPARDSLRIAADTRFGPALAGEVTNRDTGRPVVFASVTLQPGEQRATTDSLGAFRIMPAHVGGDYTIRIRAIGFAEYSDTVTMNADAGLYLHVPLVPQYVDRCPTVRRVPIP